jgi:hypothetical protein
MYQCSVHNLSYSTSVLFDVNTSTAFPSNVCCVSVIRARITPSRSSYGYTLIEIEIACNKVEVGLGHPLILSRGDRRAPTEGRPAVIERHIRVKTAV